MLRNTLARIGQNLNTGATSELIVSSKSGWRLSESCAVSYSTETEKPKDKRALSETEKPKVKRALSAKEKPKVKRPPSAYNLYLKHNFAEFKAGNPEKQAPDVMRMAADKFKELKEKDKQVYVVEANRLKEDAAKKKAEIKASEPAKVVNAWTKFVSTNYQQVKQATPGGSFADMIKTMSKMWKALSDVEKEKMLSRQALPNLLGCKPTIAPRSLPANVLLHKPFGRALSLHNPLKLQIGRVGIITKPSAAFVQDSADFVPSGLEDEDDDNDEDGIRL
eukprot:gene1229-32571_t